MLRLAPIIIFAAPTAFAFTTTHLVIVDSTPLYERGHPFDEEHVLTTLDYWTAVELITPEPEAETEYGLRKPYIYIRTEGGFEGYVRVLDVGGAYTVFKAGAPLHETDSTPETIGVLDKGEIVAHIPETTYACNIIPNFPYFFHIRNEQRLEGWVDYDNVRSLSKRFRRNPDYGDPREGPPQTARIK